MDQTLAQQIEKQILAIPTQDLSYGVLDETKSRGFKIRTTIENAISHLPQAEAQRIRDEFLGFGPLEQLFAQEEITEILLQAHDKIIYEREGRLYQLEDYFCSENTYRNFIELLCSEAKTHFNIERPMANAKFRDFRLHLISSELTHSAHNISLRRHPKNPWTLNALVKNNWCSPEQLTKIEDILAERSNFIVVGGTGTGKTSFLNACLQFVPSQERMIIIEDTAELIVPNSFSTKLVARHDANGLLPEVAQSELVKQSLRMRPDRIVMGEIRGGEAKDLLMALSTGHEGSFGSLHATSAQQALLRLEMLIQLGAPNWSVTAIRHLIKLSLAYVFVIEKDPRGLRRLQGLYKISSVEDSGFLLDQLF